MRNFENPIIEFEDATEGRVGASTHEARILHRVGQSREPTGRDAALRPQEGRIGDFNELVNQIFHIEKVDFRPKP